MVEVILDFLADKVEVNNVLNIKIVEENVRKEKIYMKKKTSNVLKTFIESEDIIILGLESIEKSGRKVYLKHYI